MRDGVIRLSEQIVQRAEVVEHPTEVDAVAMLFVQGLRALDVWERVELRKLTRTREQVQRLAHLAEIPLRGGVCEKRAQLELRGVRGKAKVHERFACVLELLPLDGGLRAGDRSLEL